MRKIIYGLIVTLIVATGLVFANRAINNETSKKLIPKPISADEKKAAMSTMGGTLLWFWKNNV